MNKIAQFRLCKLSDQELMYKVDALTVKIYQSGKIPSRHIPARPDEDYDLLVGELILRFQETMKDKVLTPKTLTAENGESELVKHKDDINEQW